MMTRSNRLQEASTRHPARAGRVDPAGARNTHSTEPAGAHRPVRHPGGPLRLLAARLIQEQMLRIGRAAHSLEGDLASLLHRFVSARGHRRLGYRRLSDYCEDRPGLPLVACRRLVQRDRARFQAASAPPGAAAPVRGQDPAVSLFPAAAGPGGLEDRPAAPASRGVAIDFDVWMDVTRAVREALQPLGPGTAAEGAAHDEPLATQPPAPPHGDRGLFDDPCVDAADLDAAIRDRLRRAQALAWRRGTLLAAAARHHLYREMGFASLEGWCAGSLRLAACGARDLLFMERMVTLHPAIGDAFRRGRLSWPRAVHAARASRPETERAWVREARRLPIERLRRAAEAAGLNARGRTTSG